ncbi:MAG: Maf family protein [Ilumatobacteraceae bacterium]
MRLVLASGSPRRARLLSEAGVEFDVAASDVDETPLPDEPPAEYVGRVALAKASVPALDDDIVVLAADTAVIVDSTILGKPHDAARHGDARAAVGTVARGADRRRRALARVRR